MYPIIHFTKLNDLLDEINPHGCHTVRISAAQKRITTNGPVPRTEVAVTVLVQTITNGTILVYVPMHKRIVFSPSYHEVDSRRRYDTAWKRAELIKGGIAKLVTDAGHSPRPGIIDMGATEPLQGEQWPINGPDEEE